MRNCNPLNINKGEPWQGLQPYEKMTPDQKAEQRFAVFKDPSWGFRAATILLRNYKIMHNLQTLKDWVDRLAPQFENNTSAYEHDVSARSGYGLDKIIDTSSRAQMFAIIKAFTHHETGSWEPWWKDADLSRGLTMAGL